MQLQYCFGLHYILFLSWRGCGEDAPNLSSVFHHLSLSGPAVHQIGRLACFLSLSLPPSNTFALVMYQRCLVRRPLMAVWLHSVGISSQPSHFPFLCHHLSKPLNAFSVCPLPIDCRTWVGKWRMSSCLSSYQKTCLERRGLGVKRGLAGTAAMPWEPSPSQSSVVPCRPIPSTGAVNIGLLRAEVGCVIRWCIKEGWDRRIHIL